MLVNLVFNRDTSDRLNQKILKFVGHITFIVQISDEMKDFFLLTFIVTWAISIVKSWTFNARLMIYFPTYIPKFTKINLEKKFFINVKKNSLFYVYTDIIIQFL